MNDNQIATASAVGDAAGKLTVLGGSGTAIYGAMTSEFIFAAIGAICALGTFLVTAYYKRKAHILEQRRLEFNMNLAMQAEERRERVAQASIDAINAGTAFPPLRDSSPGRL